MFLSNPCEDDESLCNWVYDQTDSHKAANLADWLIGGARPADPNHAALVDDIVRRRD